MVEVRKNITIARRLNDHNTFSANIRLDFIPDEVIIKSIMFTAEDPDDPNDYNTSIYTDLVNDIIGTFSNVASGNSSNPNIVFTLKGQVNRLYTFDILVPNSNTDDNEMVLIKRTGDLTIHLEFIKYRVE